MDRDEELEKILAEFGPPVSPQEPERAAEKETGPSPAAEEPPEAPQMVAQGVVHDSLTKVCHCVSPHAKRSFAQQVLLGSFSVQ